MTSGVVAMEVIAVVVVEEEVVVVVVVVVVVKLINKEAASCITMVANIIPSHDYLLSEKQHCF